MAGDDTRKITRTFEKILEADQAKYGNQTSYTIASGDSDEYQGSVGTVIGH